MDRLQILVFSFYREEPLIKTALEPLRQCRMTRSWGTVRIECLDQQHLEEVCQLMKYLRVPLAELDLGKQIVLRVPGSLQKAFPMHAPFHSDLFAG